MAEGPRSLHLRLRREAGGWLPPGVARVIGNRWFKRVVYPLVAVALLGTALLVYVARDLPSAETLLAYEPPLPTNVRDVAGAPAETFARERRVELAFDEYPPLLIRAFLSAEDKNFFTHGGLDYIGIVNAVVTNLRSDRRVGASTITQQLAKNLLASAQGGLGERTYFGKLREAILARRIEGTLSKRQILELYLNQIFLGRNAYGVQSAARAYFGKDVAQLTLPEMAYLAILPKAPANYDPDRQRERALERRAYVLREMLAGGWITPQQRAEAAATPLGTIRRASHVSAAPSGGYFLEEVRRQLIEKYGETAKDGPYSVYSGGLWVRSSLDQRLQPLVAEALRDGLVRYDRGKGWSGPIKTIAVDGDWAGALRSANVGGGYPDWRPAVVLSRSGGSVSLGFADGTTGTLPSWAASMPRRGTATAAFKAMSPGDVIVVKQDGGNWALRNIPAISGGMVAQNPHTGQVLAMQGGFDVRNSSFNRATQALRQPGSTFKPFVYAAALDSGMTPASRIVDGSFCVYQSASLGTKCFRNFSGGNAGSQTMRWGVEQSRNLMTVRTASQIGMAKVVKTASAMGVGDYAPYLGNALGAGETTVMRMVNAYSTFAHGGKALTPSVIDYVQDRRGKVILRADPRPCEGCNAKDWNGKAMPRPPARSKQVIDAMTAYQIVHILEGVIQRGTATTLRDLKRPIFGKTGTTSGPTDVWFVGGSADLIGGVYIGYDRPRPLGGHIQGGTWAAPIFKQFALEAMKGMPVIPFKAPAGIRMVRIDRKSGRRVYGAWPSDEPKAAVIWEAFKPESEPRRSIRRDEIVKRSTTKGRTATTSNRDSDFLQRQDGIY
jgi:penicillin-binding protein 1A